MQGSPWSIDLAGFHGFGCGLRLAHRVTQQEIWKKRCNRDLPFNLRDRNKDVAAGIYEFGISAKKAIR